MKPRFPGGKWSTLLSKFAVSRIFRCRQCQYLQPRSQQQYTYAEFVQECSLKVAIWEDICEVVIASEEPFITVTCAQALTVELIRIKDIWPVFMEIKPYER